VPDPARRPATALLVAMGLVSATFAVASVADLRDGQDHLVAAISRHPATVTVTTRPSLPRLAWRSDARVTWMLTDEPGLPALLAELRRAGVADVAVLTGTEVPLSELGAYPALEAVPEPAVRASGLQLVIARDR
jgi:hypothetical protein